MTSLLICERNVVDFDDIIDSPEQENTTVSKREWEEIGDKIQLSVPIEKKENNLFLHILIEKFKYNNNKPKASTLINFSDQSENDDNFCKEIKERTMKVINSLRNKDPQFDINGKGNVWIVKPAGLSRGRGIKLFNNLNEINEYLRSKESQCIVQKYIENPLVVHGRKVYIISLISGNGF